MLGAFFVIVVILIIFGLVVQLSKSTYKGAKNVSKQISNNMKDVDLERTVFSTIAKADNYIQEKKDNYNRIKRETISQYHEQQHLELGIKRINTEKGLNILINKTKNEILDELRSRGSIYFLNISHDDLNGLVYMSMEGITIDDTVSFYISEMKSKFNN